MFVFYLYMLEKSQIFNFFSLEPLQQFLIYLTQSQIIEMVTFFWDLQVTNFTILT